MLEKGFDEDLLKKKQFVSTNFAHDQFDIFRFTFSSGSSVGALSLKINLFKIPSRNAFICK